MSVHDSRNWRAIETTTDFSGREHKLTVTGEVEVGAGNEEPVLTEAVPQGINPHILILVLGTIKGGDVGADVLTWKPVKYEKIIGAHQYTQVDIRDHELIDVEEVVSLEK